MVLLRRMQPGDADAVLAGFDHLSPRSLRLRFFTANPRLTDDLRAELVKVDPETRTVLLAFDDPSGELLGGARAVRIPGDPTAAEVAVTVGDAFQHHGLGRLLLRQLRRAALAEGIERFVGHVMVDNLAARTMLAAAGATCRLFEPGVLSFEIRLRPPATAAA
jgi:acetyltransferase